MWGSVSPPTRSVTHKLSLRGASPDPLASPDPEDHQTCTVNGPAPASLWLPGSACPDAASGLSPWPAQSVCAPARGSQVSSGGRPQLGTLRAPEARPGSPASCPRGWGFWLLSTAHSSVDTPLALIPRGREPRPAEVGAGSGGCPGPGRRRRRSWVHTHQPRAAVLSERLLSAGGACHLTVDHP